MRNEVKTSEVPLESRYAVDRGRVAGGRALARIPAHGAECPVCDTNPNESLVRLTSLCLRSIRWFRTEGLIARMLWRGHGPRSRFPVLPITLLARLKPCDQPVVLKLEQKRSLSRESVIRAYKFALEHYELCQGAQTLARDRSESYAMVDRPSGSQTGSAGFPAAATRTYGTCAVSMLLV